MTQQSPDAELVERVATYISLHTTDCQWSAYGLALAVIPLIRQAVIEECAKVGDRLYNARGDEVADAIRALKR